MSKQDVKPCSFVDIETEGFKPSVSDIAIETGFIPVCFSVSDVEIATGSIPA